MDFPLCDQKAFFPSIKLKKFRLSKDKPNNSVKLMFFQRSIFQDHASPHQLLKHYYSSSKSKHGVASVCVNFKHVELQKIEDSQKEKKDKFRQISTSLNRKKGLEAGVRRRVQLKKKSLNESQRILSKRSGEKGISGQMVKMKTDTCEDFEAFQEKRYELFAQAISKKSPIFRQRLTLNEVGEEEKLSPWQFATEQGVTQL